MILFRLFRSLARPIGGVVVALLISAGIGGCGGGTDEVSLQPFPAATRAKLDAGLNQSRAALNIPGVIVSLYIPGEGFWETSVGVEDKQTQKPMLAGMHT